MTGLMVLTTKTVNLSNHSLHEADVVAGSAPSR